MTVEMRIHKSGLSFRELAEAVGCNEATAWRWATGATRVGPLHIAKLARVLGCTVEEIDPVLARKMA